MHTRYTGKLMIEYAWELYFAYNLKTMVTTNKIKCDLKNLCHLNVVNINYLSIIKSFWFSNQVTICETI